VEATQDADILGARAVAVSTGLIARWLSGVVWLLIALAYLAFFFIDLRLDVEQIQQPCRGADCNYLAVSEAELAVLNGWGLSPRAFALTMTGMSLMGAAVSWSLGGLILWRQGASSIGWAISLALIIIPVTMIADVDNLAANVPALRLPSASLSLVGTAVLWLFLYLFPNGRFYPRLAFVPLIASWLTFAFASQWFGSGLAAQSRSAAQAMGALVAGLVFLAIAFQILRYRNVSTPLERQQTKWVVTSLFSLAVAFTAWFLAFGGVVDVPPGQPRLLTTMGGWLFCMAALNGLPVAMAIAIMRFRLWDIDLVIRRTLTYSVLSALLAGTYLGSVLVLQGAFRVVTGEGQSALVTVLSTLAIAALFGPLRRRVQGLIDRRFFRRKYDAARTLAVFAAGARDETDLDRLSSQLVAVVDDAMQPAEVGLWLRSDQ
jgi:hypothetical protein